MQAHQQGDDQQYQSPGLIKAMLPLAAWTGLSMTDSWLRKDRFFGKNWGLSRGMAKRQGRERGAFLDQYYDKKFTKAVANKEERGLMAWTGREATADAARMQFKKSASTAMWKRGAAKVTGRLLGVANFLMLAPMLYGATYHGFKGIQRLGYELERPSISGGHLAMTAEMATERQRGIMAMHNSEFNGRSALGQEAFLMHR